VHSFYKISIGVGVRVATVYVRWTCSLNNSFPYSKSIVKHLKVLLKTPFFVKNNVMLALFIDDVYFYFTQIYFKSWLNNNVFSKENLLWNFYPFELWCILERACKLNLEDFFFFSWTYSHWFFCHWSVKINYNELMGYTCTQIKE